MFRENLRRRGAPNTPELGLGRRQEQQPPPDQQQGGGQQPGQPQGGDGQQQPPQGGQPDGQQQGGQPEGQQQGQPEGQQQGGQPEGQQQGGQASQAPQGDGQQQPSQSQPAPQSGSDQQQPQPTPSAQAPDQSQAQSDAPSVTSGPDTNSAATATESEVPFTPGYSTVYSVDPGGFASATAEKSPSSSGMSKSAIGGLVGGIVGAIAIAVVAFMLWRMCRGRGQKIPPPPPREVSYAASTYGNPGGGRRSQSMSQHRASSYSTLMSATAPGRTSSHFHAQHHSLASPSSSFQHDSIARFAAQATPSGSPSLSSSGTGANTPANVPIMVPVDAGLPRDGSSTSSASVNGGMFLDHDQTNSRLQRPPSSDQLRAPTPSDGGPVPSITDVSDSRTNTSDSGANSPRSSSYGFPSHRRPSGSMSSFRGPIRPMGGAPHQGRQMSIVLPRPLSLASDGLASPTQATSAISRGSYYASGAYTPRASVGDFGQMSVPPSPSHHRRGPSIGSISSRAEIMPHEAPGSPDPQFAGREEIV